MGGSYGVPYGFGELKFGPRVWGLEASIIHTQFYFLLPSVARLGIELYSTINFGVP